MVIRRDDIPIRNPIKRKQCINFTTVTLSSKAKQMKRRERELQGRSAENKNYYLFHIIYFQNLLRPHYISFG
jgi:hypothetical protein